MAALDPTSLVAMPPDLAQTAIVNAATATATPKPIYLRIRASKVRTRQKNEGEVRNVCAKRL
jgi:hypothetical protein